MCKTCKAHNPAKDTKKAAAKPKAKAAPKKAATTKATKKK
jgi:hypothetical protein